MHISVILAAGGRSLRMAGQNKLLMQLQGKTVLERCVGVFEAIPSVDEIILSAAEEWIESYRRLLLPHTVKPIRIVAGGENRQQSVLHALQAVSADADVLLIHDAARPLVTPAVIGRCLEAMRQHDAVIAAMPVKDTVKIAAPDGRIVDTPKRETLYLAQTPQVFSAGIYRAAMQNASDKGICFTDDAQLFESLGYPVFLCEGSYENLKLTTPEDIVLANAILMKRTETEEK